MKVRRSLVEIQANIRKEIIKKFIIYNRPLTVSEVSPDRNSKAINTYRRYLAEMEEEGLVKFNPFYDLYYPQWDKIRDATTIVPDDEYEEHIDQLEVIDLINKWGWQWYGEAENQGMTEEEISEYILNKAEELQSKKKRDRERKSSDGSRRNRMKLYKSMKQNRERFKELLESGKIGQYLRGEIDDEELYRTDN